MAYFKYCTIVLCIAFLSIALCSFPINYWNETGLTFDSDLITYKRTNLSEKIFEYDSENLCSLTKANGFIYVGIKSIYQYSESISQKSIPSDLTVYACFYYQGKSYIWTKNPNSISNSELFSLPNNIAYLNLDFNVLRFDVVSQQFLTFNNGIFTIYNFGAFLKNPKISPLKIIPTNYSCTDIRYINEKIYCLENHTIFYLNSNILKYYSPYFTNHFQFLLFPISKNEDSSVISKCNFNSHLFLYLIDIIVIILLVIVFRNRLSLDSRFGNIRYSPPPIIRKSPIKDIEKMSLNIEAK